MFDILFMVATSYSWRWECKQIITPLIVCSPTVPPWAVPATEALKLGGAKSVSTEAKRLYCFFDKMRQLPNLKSALLKRLFTLSHFFPSSWLAHNSSNTFAPDALLPCSLRGTQCSPSLSSWLLILASISRAGGTIHHHQMVIFICKYQQCTAKDVLLNSPLLSKQLLVQNRNNKRRNESSWPPRLLLLLLLLLLRSQISLHQRGVFIRSAHAPRRESPECRDFQPTSLGACAWPAFHPGWDMTLSPIIRPTPIRSIFNHIFGHTRHCQRVRILLN